MTKILYSGGDSGDAGNGATTAADDLMFNPLGIVPFDDRVLIREMPEPAVVLPAGVVLPSGVRLEGLPLYGVVVAVGPGLPNKGAPGATRIPPQASVGQFVYFNGYMAAKFRVGALLFRLAPGEAVLCGAARMEPPPEDRR